MTSPLIQLSRHEVPEREQPRRGTHMSQPQGNEINDVMPTSLRHLIGQEGVTAQVAVALEAAFADGRRFDHSLLVGPPGLGKSQSAKIIAAEMATDIHEVLGQSITCA